MPNIAALLKSEITRIARKEGKAQVRALMKSIRAYRSDIAELKRRVQELERALRRADKGAAASNAPASAAQPEAKEPARRFSPKGLTSLRKRLDLSAADFGRLVGASALTIYKWEQGKARPRARFAAALAGVRGIGKKEAARRLQQAG